VDRRPERVARLVLGVRSPDLVMRRFLPGMIGLSLALGFDGVVMVVGGLIHGPGPPPGVIVGFGLGTLLVGGGLRGWSVRREWITVAWPWSGLFALHFGFMGAIVGWW